MKYHFAVHSKRGVPWDGKQCYDDRTIISEAETLELAIEDMKTQVLAFAGSRGEGLELVSFTLLYIEA